MKTLKPEFVEFIPEQLSDDVLYISMKYKSARHMCVCGCGCIVITPITPTDWQIKFDGKSVSLRPSIGNWSFPCRSHYWIIGNEIRWAEPWTSSQFDGVNKTHENDVKQRAKHGEHNGKRGRLKSMLSFIKSLF